jgi:hypothetical protein
MFTYKNYIIEREDDNNISVYRKETVEIREGGGRGKGPGTATGKFEEKKVHKSYQSSFSGALEKVLELEMENCADVSQIIQKIDEFKNLVKTIKIPF